MLVCRFPLHLTITSLRKKHETLHCANLSMLQATFSLLTAVTWGEEEALPHNPGRHPAHAKVMDP